MLRMSVGLTNGNASEVRFALTNKLEIEVPTRWVRLHPTYRLDAAFWMRVLEIAYERDIDNSDLSKETNDKVRAIIDEVERDMIKA
jgi:predicted DNA-binding ribbon-helix-helix protein